MTQRSQTPFCICCWTKRSHQSWLLLVFEVIGVALFAAGFLLTRVELSDVSACPLPHAQGPLNNGSASAYCQKPAFAKAVFIVIDGLRFDSVQLCRAQQCRPGELKALSEFVKVRAKCEGSADMAIKVGREHRRTQLS